ncbi:MAG: hypothetical protein L0Y35_05415 [Flammeovirgaceae bacterium]|nr:hypothetical protein [Flammeovirgaceae bacterium]
MKKVIQILKTCLFLTFFVSCSSDKEEDNVIERGEAIQHDDFQYVVEHYEIKDQLDFPDDTIPTDGKFIIVKFKVINNAVKVDHEWNNSIAHVVDENGNIYENKPELQAKLNKVTPFGLKDEYITPFQTDESTIFVFELPSSVKNPYLMVRGETLMKDFFEGNKFRRTKVRLYES